MTLLNLAPNITDPDALYDQLVRLHDDLDAPASAVVNSALILLLANHVGDPIVIGEAIKLARQAAPSP